MKSLAVLLAGVALAAGANAATASFSFANALQTTEINQTASLGLFDTTLGTLTGVSLTFGGNNTTILGLTNNAQQSQTTRATSTTDLFFSSSLGGLNGLIAAANPVVSLSATTGFVTLSAGETRSFGPLLDSDAVTWGNVELGGILASFGQAGGGNFNLGCTSLSGISIQGGGGNIASTQATQAACSGEIVYTYDTTPPGDVPEPGALALVGIALAGLSLIRRKAAKA